MLFSKRYRHLYSSDFLVVFCVRESRTVRAVNYTIDTDSMT